jgi:hypothetical protein
MFNCLYISQISETFVWNLLCTQKWGLRMWERLQNNC